MTLTKFRRPIPPDGYKKNRNHSTAASRVSALTKIIDDCGGARFNKGTLVVEDESSRREIRTLDC